MTTVNAEADNQTVTLSNFTAFTQSVELLGDGKDSVVFDDSAGTATSVDLYSNAITGLGESRPPACNTLGSTP